MPYDDNNMHHLGYLKLPRVLLALNLTPRTREYCYPDEFALIWLIAEANYLPGSKIIEGKKYYLNRGQLVASVRFLSERFGWKGSARAHRFLERLESLGYITKETETGLCKITICNYDNFQDTPNGYETQKDQTEKKTVTNNKRITQESTKNNLPPIVPPQEYRDVGGYLEPSFDIKRHMDGSKILEIKRIIGKHSLDFVMDEYHIYVNTVARQPPEKPWPAFKAWAKNWTERQKENQADY